MASAKVPNYRRQKALLLLISMAGGKLTRTDLQKLLFLVTRSQAEPYYDFVPYRFGCYSFQAAEDLEILRRLGWIRLSGTEVRLRNGSIVKTALPGQEIAQLYEGIKRYQNLRGNRLIRFIYRQYPYFVIHSEIAKDMLDDTYYESILELKARLTQTETVLFTIGYEGLKFESYVNRLIENNIRLLCDVRRNPLSRKFGFSKTTLSTILPKVGIAYVHIPELGIVSDRRKSLKTKEEFQCLFRQYRSELLHKKEALARLHELIDEFGRVALTCFEQHHNSCHRHCISDSIGNQRDLTVVHL